MSGETLTIQMTTDQLRKLIRDELGQAMSDVVTSDQLDKALNDRPRLRDVNDLIKAEVDRAFDSALEAMRDVRDGIKEFDNRFASVEKSLALLLAQSQNTSEAIREVKNEQDELEKKMDKTQERVIKLETTTIGQAAKLESQEHAIFGDKTRPGTKSLFDHMSEGINQLSTQVTTRFDEMMTQIQIEREQSHQEMARLQRTTEDIKTDVEANKAFRERRQQIESLALQAFPKAVKRVWQAATDDWVVKWATRIGLGGALAVLAALLERLQ
jgi:chromosome segregation ATPase